MERPRAEGPGPGWTRGAAMVPLASKAPGGARWSGVGIAGGFRHEPLQFGSPDLHTQAAQPHVTVLPSQPSEGLTKALSHLLKVCLEDAAKSHQTRDSLRALTSWLTEELEALEGSKAASHGVLTPAARGRASEPTIGSEGPLTDALNVVLKRTRWKAAACRVSAGRQALRHLTGGERSAAEAQLSQQERTLRESLTQLRDTIPWMLDQPFGLRANQEGAFDVPDALAAKLVTVADCYEALSTTVEKARELEEAGVFEDGPPRAFLYLMAEAQSALLASIADAPVRSDSDQRDVFLWLKEQTTRFRIYVDRHMRLDDLADCTQSADIRQRVEQLCTQLTCERQGRRQRGQLLSKIRYHVGKLLEEGGTTRSEVASLGVALKRWSEAGLDRGDGGLAEALSELRAKAGGAEGEAGELLASLLGSNRKSPPRPADEKLQEERQGQSLEETRQLIGGLRAVLLAPPSAQLDAKALTSDLGAADLEVLIVDVDGPKEARAAALEGVLSAGDAALFLLGVRLAPEEYNAFKEACLEQKVAFVRLPGQLTALAIAHQVMRQVGWRLRAQLGEAAT